MAKRQAVVLGGIKHCGKSSVGKELAALLGRRCVDTDRALEALFLERNGEKLDAREIFRREGEDYFRRLEAEAVAMVLNRPDAGKLVVALGGGVPANPYLPAELTWGAKVWLAVPAEVIYRRIAAGGFPPFLPGGEGFDEWFREREKFYRGWADVKFDADGGDPVAVTAGKLAAALHGEGMC